MTILAPKFRIRVNLIKTPLVKKYLKAIKAKDSSLTLRHRAWYILEPNFRIYLKPLTPPLVRRGI